LYIECLDKNIAYSFFVDKAVKGHKCPFSEAEPASSGAGSSSNECFVRASKVKVIHVPESKRLGLLSDADIVGKA
jgi:hypothetical protein